MNQLKARPISQQLLTVAEQRELTEEESRELIPALADESGEYEQTTLDDYTFQQLLQAGFLRYCSQCTRNTILDCADVKPDEYDYTAAEYHVAADHTRACIARSGILVSGMEWSIHDKPCQRCQEKPLSWAVKR